MQYSYKRVNEENREYINELCQVRELAFEEVSTLSEDKPSNEYLLKILSDSNCIVLVATEENNEVIGGLVAYVLPKIDQEQSEIYLYDIAVAAEYRRQGVATRLILELKEIAKHYGASVIFVQADNEDVEAVALYTKLSNRANAHITHFDIDVS